MKYLFRHMGPLKDAITGGRAVLFLDYDGTLSPIADRPDQTGITLTLRASLKRLSRKIKIAVISGRSLRDIKKLVALKGIVYVGNHGLEIEGPQLEFRGPAGPEVKRFFKRVADGLKRELLPVKGAVLEDKGFSLSVHYRLVDKKDKKIFEKAFYRAAGAYIREKKVRFKKGRKVFELRPPLEWDKGRAVLWLLSQKKFAQRKGVFPIYLGDDATDEDAFKVLPGRGAGVLVGRRKPSYARYYLKNCGEVERFLSRVDKICQR